MKLFPEQKDKRRLAVTAGLLLLAAVLLFAAEALLDNLHGRPLRGDRIHRHRRADAVRRRSPRRQLHAVRRGQRRVRHPSGRRRQRHVFHSRVRGPHLPCARIPEDRRLSGNLCAVQPLRILFAGWNCHRAAGCKGCAQCAAYLRGFLPRADGHGYNGQRTAGRLLL